MRDRQSLEAAGTSPTCCSTSISKQTSAYQATLRISGQHAATLVYAPALLEWVACCRRGSSGARKTCCLIVELELWRPEQGGQTGHAYLSRCSPMLCCYITPERRAIIVTLTTVWRSGVCGDGTQGWVRVWCNHAPFAVVAQNECLQVTHPRAGSRGGEVDVIRLGGERHACINACTRLGL